MSEEALWSPAGNTTQLSTLQAELEQRAGKSFGDYDALHAFSISDQKTFWRTVSDLTGVIYQTPAEEVLSMEKGFNDVQWFAGSRLNFAENLLRYRDDRVALVCHTEEGLLRTLSYAALYKEVVKLATAMQASGIRTGDRVAGFMPNTIETVVAMLATSWLGAIWSSCSPDFGVNGVCDRFGQIAPRLLFVADGYIYGGKPMDCLDKAKDIRRRINTIERMIVVPHRDSHPDIEHLDNTILYEDFLAESEQLDPPPFAVLPFDHPLYLMYSSGTTGEPKCIVHGVGGTLLQHLKEHRFHLDLQRNDVLFYFTTCGWMMWNWLVSGLATGCTVVLYEGSPFAHDGNRLLDLIDTESVTVFGTSAKYLTSLEDTGAKPIESHGLKYLRTILSTGSPLNASSYEFVYKAWKSDVALCSISGGTDILSCFVLGNPNAPIYRGEIQCKGLGMAVEIWNDEGESIIGEKGELVCTRPFPSAPLGFWGDTSGSRYLATYFERFPGVWAHGDYGEITARGGIIIHGRSDTVLNPGGVRIGTAEIYRQVEQVGDVIDSVVIGQEWDRDVRVVLFVVLRDDVRLTPSLEDLIKKTIRKNTTPRHVPAVILQVPDIPRTISGKVVEVAVREVVHGRAVRNIDALANPEALAAFGGRSELAG